MSKSSEEGAAGNGPVQESGNVVAAQKDANGNIYENRAGTKKVIRVVTVMAYVFSVSFAAILLSAYYVFLWEPPNPRLQRHPLSGYPQVEFLMDNLLSRKNVNNINGPEDHLVIEERENPSKKFNNILFERIMTGDHEEPRRTDPQKLIAFQDFAESHIPGDAATTNVSDDPGEIASTTLPIFLKALATNPTVLTPGYEPGENKGGNIFGQFKISRIDERNDSENPNSPGPGEIMNNETTLHAGSTESDTPAVMSTRDLQATIYPRIDNRSYPKAIGATVKNNKVTIGAESTIETSTAPIPSRISDLDENFEISLRKQDDIPAATTNSEVQIYPEELNRDDILDDRN